MRACLKSVPLTNLSKQTTIDDGWVMIFFEFKTFYSFTVASCMVFKFNKKVIILNQIVMYICKFKKKHFFKRIILMYSSCLNLSEIITVHRGVEKMLTEPLTSSLYILTSTQVY